MRGAPAAEGKPRLRALIGAAAASAVLVTFALCSCSAASPDALWYQLQSGRLQRIAGIGSAQSTPLQPWTVQARLADEAFFHGTLYFAVNGYGILAADVEGTSPVFQYLYDSTIFSHRTVTDLVPRKDGLVAHLYFNEILNTADRAALSCRGISLVNLDTSKGGFSFITPPFQKRDPQWEAVGFLARGQDDFLFEWKLSGPTETRFAYTWFNPDSGEEQTISRESYIAAYQLSSAAGSGPDASEAGLFAVVRKNLPELTDQNAVHFSLLSLGNPVKRLYRSGEGISSLLSVPIFQEGSASFVLLPAGRVLRVSAAGAAVFIALPALPPRLSYTGIVKVGDSLVLPWEESRFTDVGSAGMLVFKLPK
jgi:hypothetical protein